MFTALIVDDEGFVRNGLANHVRWDEHDVSLVRVAADGVAGLEVADEIKPDLVLTDIRMPRMDGIEFAAELRARHPDAIIVFMSAYSDKEYLKSAIKLQVLGYIDKPVDLAEANAMIARAIEQCRRRSGDAVESRSRSIGRLVDGGLGEADADRVLSGLGASPADDANFLVAIVECRHGTPDAQVALDPEIRRLLSREGIVVAFGELPSVPCCAIVGRTERPTKQFTTSEESVIERALSAAGSDGDPCFVAVGGPATGWRRLSGALESAQSAYTLRYVYGYGRTVWASRSLDTPSGTSAFDAEPAIRAFNDALDAEDVDATDRVLAASVSAVESLPPSAADPVAVRNAAYELMRCLDRFSERRSVATTEGDGLAGSWEHLTAARTYREAGGIVGTLARELVAAVRTARENSGVIDRVRHLIKERYYDADLSVGWLSDIVGVSEAHLSVRYKREVGTTIYSSILDARISRAKELLRDPSTSIQSVAIDVGYRDQTYFTKVFKRETGQTPTDYRRTLG